MSDPDVVDYRLAPGPAKAGQHFNRAVAAILFGGMTAFGVSTAMGGFTWAVRDGQSVRLPMVIMGACFAAAGMAFLDALRMGWLQAGPSRHDFRVAMAGIFTGLGTAALAYL